ncbi:transcription factor E4F1 isoform X3 [Narcine bancroftii]|uniref:transcription factor E4F1 isoform X3 n=1 Tax=Narcine bancroftii TaxID=1343680 RepID=UPI0038320A9C
MSCENTADGQRPAAPGGGGDEEEHDVHKCGRCQAEFCSLEGFITHKLQKVCQRSQTSSLGAPEHHHINQAAFEESVSLDSAITLTQLVVASLAQPEANTKSHSDDGSDKACQISDEQFCEYPQLQHSEQLTSEEIDGQSCQKNVEEESGAEKKRCEMVLTDEGRFMCQVCEKTFKTAVILKAHMVTHSDKKPFKCKICGMAFRTKGSLVRHNRRHTDERPYKCRMCGMSFRESGALTRHLKAITPCTEKVKFQQMKLISTTNQDGSVNKPETQEVNKQIEELVSTEEPESAETTAVISVLTNSEGSIEQVQVHNMSQDLNSEAGQKPQSPASTELAPEETTNENLICQAMRNSGIVIETVTIGDSQKSTEVSQLTAEGDTVEDVAEDCIVMEEDDTAGLKGENNCKQFKCPHCSRVFRGSSYLRLHIKAHLGYKPHRCELCEKEFMTAYILKKHLESHYNERRFKCGECGKLYKSIAHVKEHMRAHSDDRPYPCPVCGKKYKTKTPAEVTEGHDVGSLTQGSKVDSQIMKVVQQIVHQATSGHQIIVQNVSMEENTEQGTDTITIATPAGLTEQVAMSLASSVGEGAVLATEGSLDTSQDTVTVVTSDDIEMLENADEYVITTQDGEVEIQTVVVGE